MEAKLRASWTKSKKIYKNKMKDDLVAELCETGGEMHLILYPLVVVYVC